MPRQGALYLAKLKERGGSVSCGDDRFKNFRNVKKTNPRLLSPEIYRYIVNNSEQGLNAKQVAECFQLYARMLSELYMSPYAEKDMTVLLPHIGNFYLVKWNGRKGGSTYKLFDEKVVTLDKSEPSFYRIKFKIFKTLYEGVKNKTKHYE